MWSSDSEADLAAAAAMTTTTASSSPSSTSSSSSSPSASPPPPPQQPQQQPRRRRTRRSRRQNTNNTAGAEATEDVWRGAQWESAWPRRASPVVVVAAEETSAAAGGGSSSPSGEGMGRARSLTDDDLEELKGCVDLGFGFSYDEIPELCGTLPALELCYSMRQRFNLDDHHHQETPAPPSPSPPIANWKISSPGDSPEEVKARLKYWAQAVACTVRLCS